MSLERSVEYIKTLLAKADAEVHRLRAENQRLMGLPHMLRMKKELADLRTANALLGEELQKSAAAVVELTAQNAELRESNDACVDVMRQLQEGATQREAKLEWYAKFEEGAREVLTIGCYADHGPALRLADWLAENPKPEGT